MRSFIFFIFVICSFLSLSLRAQLKPQELDSMLKVLPSMPDDTNKVLLYCKFSSHYFRLENPEACLAFFYKATALAEKLNFWKGMALAHNTKGNMYGIYNDHAQMIKDFLIAEEYYNKINSKAGLAETFVNIRWRLSQN